MLPPAPPRGCYDRASTRQARQVEQYDRLLQATTRALAGHGEEPSVTKIVGAARMGRNTFYEHFRGLEDAVEQATSHAAATLRRRLRESQEDVWTPRERLRSALGAWVAFVVDEPFVARALLSQPSKATHFALTRAGEVLHEVLQPLLHDALRDAVISTPPEPLRVVGVTAAVEAIGRTRLEQPWNRVDHVMVAVDLVVRAFR